MINFKNYNPRNLKSLFNKPYIKNRCVSFCINWCAPKLTRKRLISIIVILTTITLLNFYLIKAPSDFPKGSFVSIEEGKTLSEIAEHLKEENVIKSTSMYMFLTRLSIRGKGVMAGDYVFGKDYSVISIVWKTIRGVWGISPTRVTILEGYTIYDIADVLSNKFDKFNKDKFIRLAEDEEGFLFPDTYYFLPNVTPRTVIKTMKDNFDTRIEEIAEQIEDSGKTLEEIVIMASLLEKEARTLKSKQIISGILWKRIDINMPLQVDAVFPYINGKNTYQLSLEDLKVDSPYNTYANKGLPIGPIANPSIYSLLAAVTPIESNYLFYLSDRQGNMYYSEDFEEHKRYKRLYIY
ncbi:MAG: endolytic transglycosylase MltG [Candidatus Pacebacteria bacterium]|nr:endolytic transglycosylase MltG [Candidatus Paceibacterota bacterium]